MDSPIRSTTNRFSGSFVDVEAGMIRREVFTDPEIYARELERIFARTWLYVAHESQIPNPGDFMLSRMGEESVIVTRDQAGKVHVLLNNCTHRGMRVCRYDQGNTQYFTCPYHAWSFGIAGDLATVPKMKASYENKLDRSKWGLTKARVEILHNSIWACWAESGPSLDEYLGGIKFYLDDYFEMYDGTYGGWEAVGGIFKWKIPCNWKFGAENFSGDYYHQPSHASVEAVLLSPAGTRGRHTYDEVTKARSARLLNICAPGTGHTGRGQLFKEDYDYLPTYQERPIIEDYFRECYYKRQKLLGEKSRWFGHGGTIFPNLSYSNGVMSLGVWHPDGPNRTEVWRTFLVPKDAPEEVKKILRHYVIRYQGPSGLTEQDDMENWNYAHEGARGTIARRRPYNYEMGMDIGGPPPAPWLGENNLSTDDTTEQNQREYFRRWAELMDT